MPEFTKKIKTYRHSDLAAMMPPIADDINKSNRGGVLICGGSWNYRGAPVLAALGALRAGAGYVVLAVPDFMINAASVILPEAVFEPILTIADNLCAESFEQVITKWTGQCSAAVLGPGLGRNQINKSLVRCFWNNWQAPLLLDADALFTFAEIQEELPYRDDVVITPHTGEAARILHVKISDVEAGRQQAVLALTNKSGTALLKGNGTLVSHNNEIRMIREGTQALAVPGSGDVLSGITGAFLASGMNVFDAATAAALAHACVGNEMMKKYGPRGALARDIADGIPYVLQ